MRVLIIGANGMLGHKLCQVLSHDFDVHGTIRGDTGSIAGYGFFDTTRITANVNVTDTPRVAAAIESIRPEAVINAAGVVKARESEAGVFENRRVNALFPHELYRICSPRKIRIIHLSTDCVFSGKTGNYTEDDPSDAGDIYGQTKFMGEISGEGALTVRTSMIGRELGNQRGLLEWFISNRGGTVNGYTNAVFSGFPTLHLARIIADILKNHAGLSGIYHISADAISKYRLLSLINTAMKLTININEYPDEVCDRSLDSTKFRRETGFTPLAWETMIEEMAKDAADYPAGR